MIFVVIIITFVFSGCEKQSGFTAEQIYNIKSTLLSDEDKIEALKAARRFLTNDRAETKSIKGRCYEKGERGVFVSVARPKKPALTGFAMGHSIVSAIEKATMELKEKAKGDDLGRYRIRVDVIDKSSSRKSWKPGKHWKLDISKYGVIFDSNPIAALLPQELRDRGVINHKGRVDLKRLKKILGYRGCSTQVINSILKSEKVSYTRTSFHSFMEDEKGGLVKLNRMNRAAGFSPTEDNLRKAIDAAGKYLAKAVKEDGSFEYHYHPQTNSLSRDYNELRHAGTTFAMMQIYETNKDQEVLDGVKRALGWLEKHTRDPDHIDKEKYNWKALNDKQFRYGKLGGSGLSLLAFGWYTKVTGDTQYLPLMQGYGEFIHYMMKENGDVKMRYWYKAKDKGRHTKPVLYYPGEAFFGLATLYSIDKNMKWIDVGAKGIDYIVDIRDKNKLNRMLPHDHWMAYAITNIYKVKPKDSHVKHAWRLFSAMDDKFHYEHKYDDFVGGYFKTPVSVRVGCRLEATTAFYRLAEHLGEKERLEKFFHVLQKGASFLMRTQYDNYNTMFFENPEKPIGAMMRSYWEPSTQIDYTQHSVSALIEIYNITKERVAKNRE